MPLLQEILDFPHFLFAVNGELAKKKLFKVTANRLGKSINVVLVSAAFFRYQNRYCCMIHWKHRICIVHSLGCGNQMRQKSFRKYWITPHQVLRIKRVVSIKFKELNQNKIYTCFSKIIMWGEVDEIPSDLMIININQIESLCIFAFRSINNDHWMKDRKQDPMIIDTTRGSAKRYNLGKISIAFWASTIVSADCLKT